MNSNRAAISAAEYARRLAGARAVMAAAGIGRLCDHDRRSFHTRQAVILGKAGDPVWWGRRKATGGARRTVRRSDDDILGDADHSVQSTTRHPMEEPARDLDERGLATARIGVEKEDHYHSAKAHEVLAAGLPSATRADATARVNRCRAAKSDEDLADMRKAARSSAT